MCHEWMVHWTTDNYNIYVLQAGSDIKNSGQVNEIVARKKYSGNKSCRRCGLLSLANKRKWLAKC